MRSLASLLSIFLGACAVNPLSEPPPPPPPSPSPPPGVQSQWQVLQRDGHALGRRQQWQYCDAQRCYRSEVTDIAVQQPGAPVATSRVRLDYIESINGEALSLSKRLDSTAANHHWQLLRWGNAWQLRQADHREPLALPAAPLFPDARRRAMQRNQGRAPLQSREWSFSKRQLETVRYRFFPIEESALTAEVRAQLAPWLSRIHWRIVREQASEQGWQRQGELFSDADFSLIAERHFSPQGDLWLLPCDRACQQESLQPPPHVYQRLLRSPYRISDEALRGKIRYQLGGASDAELPATGEQAVSQQGDKAWVTVCDDCGDDTAPAPDALQAAMEASYWLPHRDPAMRAVVAALIGDRAAQAAMNPRARMQRLTRFVSSHMDEVATYSGYATALEALESGRGDCTEHALLLATLARAAGIPSRVVMGVAYNNERFLGRRFVFVPHMWVQAWTGERWESFDSGLGAFTAGYIALALSGDGDQREFLAMNAVLDKLTIESATRLQSRPTEP